MPRSAPSARCPTARSTPACAACSTRASSPRPSGTQHAAATAGSKRARIVYELTADGKEHFQELVKEAGPTAWEDDTFDVHFAFFARTEAEVRLRILEGRRSRLEERLDTIRTSSAKNRERFDTYTAALERHGWTPPSARSAGSTS